MSYYLAATIAKEELFRAKGIEYRPLKQGFGITTKEVEMLPGVCAWVSADFFGGFGEQTSIVYSDGKAVKEFGPSYDAIDQALKEIGAVRTEKVDEFDILGLGDERANEWLKTADD